MEGLITTFWLKANARTQQGQTQLKQDYFYLFKCTNFETSCVGIKCWYSQFYTSTYCVSSFFCFTTVCSTVFKVFVYTCAMWTDCVIVGCVMLLALLNERHKSPCWGQWAERKEPIGAVAYAHEPGQCRKVPRSERQRSKERERRRERGVEQSRQSNRHT